MKKVNASAVYEFGNNDVDEQEVKKLIDDIRIHHYAQKCALSRLKDLVVLMTPEGDSTANGFAGRVLLLNMLLPDGISATFEKPLLKKKKKKPTFAEDI